MNRCWQNHVLQCFLNIAYDLKRFDSLVRLTMPAQTIHPHRFWRFWHSAFSLLMTVAVFMIVAFVFLLRAVVAVDALVVLDKIQSLDPQVVCPCQKRVPSEYREYRNHTERHVMPSRSVGLNN